MKIDVISLDSEVTGSIDLADEVFALEARPDIVHRVVLWQLAKRQAGTHRVKTVSEINATTKKMFKQKGTGSARHGSKKVSQFRGGAKVMGPVVRSHAFGLTKKLRQLALRSVLSDKMQSGNLVIVDNIQIESNKTSFLKEKFTNLGWKSVLVIDAVASDNLAHFEQFSRAARNIIGVDVLPVVGTNVYDVLRRDRLVLTRSAVDHLEARLK